MAEIIVTTPPGVVGAADVEVTNPDGQAVTFTGGFTYIAPAPSIASVSPGSGPVAGGTQIVVSGSDLDADAIVTIGGIVASPLIASVWPDNEPAGLVPVFPGHPTIPGVLIDGSEHRFDYTAQGGSDLGAGHFFGQEWDGGPRILSVTDPTSKYGSVIRKNMLIGDVGGWNGNASIANFAADYEALYMRMVFKFSANWQHHGSMDKLFFFGEGNDSANDFYVGLAGVARGKRVIVLKNQGNHAGDSGEWRSQVHVTKDEWHTLELSIVTQSALGVADGSFWMRYNGVDIDTFNFLALGDHDPGQNAIAWYNPSAPQRLFSGLELFLFYGGSGSAKLVNDHIDISEFYVTGKEAA